MTSTFYSDQFNTKYGDSAASFFSMLRRLMYKIEHLPSRILFLYKNLFVKLSNLTNKRVKGIRVSINFIEDLLKLNNLVRCLVCMSMEATLSN